jgi:hypothetical protein
LVNHQCDSAACMEPVKGLGMKSKRGIISPGVNPKLLVRF